MTGKGWKTLTEELFDGVRVRAVHTSRHHDVTPRARRRARVAMGGAVDLRIKLPTDGDDVGVVRASTFARARALGAFCVKFAHRGSNAFRDAHARTARRQRRRD